MSRLNHGRRHTGYNRYGERDGHNGKPHVDLHDRPAKEVTISIGVSTYPQTGQVSEDLVRAADRAMYNAKENGRNRVAVAESALTV